MITELFLLRCRKDPIYTLATTSIRRRAAGFKAHGENKIKSLRLKHGTESINGSNRHKFFSRPVLPHLHADNPEVLLASADVSLTQSMSFEENVVYQSRSVGIQTMYRDSEAQTIPYTPEYKLFKNQPSPEVLSLTHLRYGAGLPAAESEIQMIERNRDAKQFAYSLPPLTDEASYQLRKRMMEARELKQWEYREREIDDANVQRLDLFRQSLMQRDKEHELHAAQRIDGFRQKLEFEKNITMHKSKLQRLMVLRKLSSKMYSDMAQKQAKRDIIQQYADYASPAYVDVLHNGLRKVSSANKVIIAKSGGASIESTLQLQMHIPAHILKPRAYKVPVKRIRTAKDRTHALAEEHLLRMEKSLITQSLVSNEDVKSCTIRSPPRRRRRQRDAYNRPPTPDYVMSRAHVEHDTIAIVLLQRLLRGRSVQNMMFEGKEKYLALIQELRLSEKANTVDEEPDAVSHESQVVDSAYSRIEGEIVSEILDGLYKEKDRAKETEQLKQFVQNAKRERILREVNESAKRQAEQCARDIQDQIYGRLECMHYKTAMGITDDSIRDIIDHESSREAHLQTLVMREGLIPILNSLETEFDSEEIVIMDILAASLFPFVQWKNKRRQQMQEEKKFACTAQFFIEKLLHKSTQPASSAGS